MSNLTSRRRIVGALATAGLMLGALFGPAAPAAAATTVAVPDAGLANCLAKELGMAAGTTEFAVTELATVSFLQCEDAGISNLAGAQYLTSLEKLNLYGNQISDLSQLSGLTKLDELWLTQNKVTSLAPLAGLPNLARLAAADNRISDLAPLSGLKLTYLQLRANLVSDVSPLAGMTSLTSLTLADNKLADVSALAGLTKLLSLDLRKNQISDVSSLAGLAEVDAADQTLALSLKQGIATALPLKGFGGEVPAQTSWPEALEVSGHTITATAAGVHAVDFEDVAGYFTGTLTVTVTAAPAVTAGAPTISGTVKIGQQLRVKAGTWSPAGTVLSYQWYRDGAEVSGATAATYRVTTGDAGSKLKVQVTGAASGYRSAKATTAAKTVPWAGKIKLTSVKLTGKAKVGAKLKITLKGVKPKGVKVRYAWRRGTNQIAGATRSAYQVVTADKGKYLTGVVTLTKAGYKQVVKITKRVKIK